MSSVKECVRDGEGLAGKFYSADAGELGWTHGSGARLDSVCIVGAKDACSLVVCLHLGFLLIVVVSRYQLLITNILSVWS
jgi:hypothetical protein